MPNLALTFVNPNDIEEQSFHACVRNAPFDRESIVSFVPPDGSFTLMTYRAATHTPSTPLWIRPTITWHRDSARFSMVMGTKPMCVKGGGGGSTSGGTMATTTRNNSGGISSGSPSAVTGAVVDVLSGLDDIKLIVTFPKAVKSVDLTSDVGVVHVDPVTHLTTWTIGRYPRDKAPELSGTIYLAPGEVTVPIETPHAQLFFTLAGTTVSGLSVKDLVLTGEKYKFFKGVKTMVQTGRYQVRT